MKGLTLLLPAAHLASAMALPRQPLLPATDDVYVTLAEVEEMHRRGELQHLARRDACSYDVPEIDSVRAGILPSRSSISLT